MGLCFLHPTCLTPDLGEVAKAQRRSETSSSLHSQQVVEAGFSPKCQLLRNLCIPSVSMPGMGRGPGHWPRPGI